MDCACLIAIIETLQRRSGLLETRLGTQRAARLARRLCDTQILGDILHSWALAVASEHTVDHDTTVAMHILLALFAAEAPIATAESFEELRAYGHRWADRCIRRLARGMVLDELVFRGSGECASPKWGAGVTTETPSPTRRSARTEL
jgi:hypothetical protein